MNKIKLLPAIAILVVFIILIITVVVVSKPNLTFLNQSRANLDSISLSLSSSNNAIVLGEPRSINIIINTADKTIYGQDLSIKYDPGMVSVEKVVPGDIFEKILVSNSKNGIINFSSVTKSPKNTNGILATLIIKGLNRGSTELSFLPATDIIEAGTYVNILQSTQGISLEVK